MSPEKWLLAAFLALIVIGAGVLSLPVMTTAGGISMVDALFTAASAVCVTGLMVLDIEADFTAAGRTVILVLIQSGGLGIITLASLLILSVQRRLPIAYDAMVTSTVAVVGAMRPRSVALAVIRYALIIEAIGIALLLIVWPGDLAPLDRLWTATFHAISAFCNSGIGLLANSLESLRGNAGVNLVMMGLIVLGGFGFINLHEIVHRVRTGTLRWSRCSLFFKVSVTFTLALNLGGAAVLLALESGDAFAGLSTGETLLAAAFHSVTTRTAGFHTIPMSDFGEVSLRLVMLLMFVGAVSGSCAGGVKVGTLAVLVAIVRGHLRNDTEPVLFNRRLSRTDQRRAVVLLVASLALFYAAFAVLLALEGQAVEAQGHSAALALGFETISALGTVGLSTGVTPHLTAAGKGVLIVLMIIGRLGPLAVIAAWARRPTPRPYTFPEESLPVG
jgi:trk system potassium uptake protein